MGAAQNLIGKVLENGWEVIEFIKNESDTETKKRSTCYKVKNSEEKEAFLKAIDLSEVTKVGDTFKELERITNRANNEKEIAQKCAYFGLKNVVEYYDSGQIQGKELSDTVHYIIYEKAISDCEDIINNFGINITSKTIYERLVLLHNITNALRNLHKVNIAHQDLKPSNILRFNKLNKNVFKIGDFDCAILKTEKTLAEELDKQQNIHSGTYRFAPIELLYKHVDTDWDVVRKGTDYYLIGSLICFCFTGRSITEMIADKLTYGMHWQRETKDFDYLKNVHYFEKAFSMSIMEFNENLSEHQELATVLSNVIFKLCHPNPRKRGEIANIKTEKHHFTLIPTVSKLGLQMSKYKYK